MPFIMKRYEVISVVNVFKEGVPKQKCSFESKEPSICVPNLLDAFLKTLDKLFYKVDL